MKRNWILFTFFAFIVVSAGFISIYNSRNDVTIGNTRPETVDLSQCSEAAREAAKQVGNIYSCESRQLSNFTVVDLGSDPLNDCPSGCFPSIYRFTVSNSETTYIGGKYGALGGMNSTMDENEVMVPLKELDENDDINDLTKQVN